MNACKFLGLQTDAHRTAVESAQQPGENVPSYVRAVRLSRHLRGYPGPLPLLQFPLMNYFLGRLDFVRSGAAHRGCNRQWRWRHPHLPGV
jgi:hypothetical protein